MVFMALMALIEQIATGEMTLEDVIPFGGMIVPSYVVIEQVIDEDGEFIGKHEYIEFDYEHAVPDRECFTEDECRELKQAWDYAYWNVKDTEDMYKSALIDWNS